MPNSPTNSPAEIGGVAVDSRHKTEIPRRFKVLLHNDDYTTMEFVIDVLRQFFHKTEPEATHIMLTVHKKGRAVAGIYTRDIAESKVARVLKYARESKMPLLVTAEPE